MGGRIVELQCLDMSERPGVGQAGNIRDGRMRPDIQHDLIAREGARAAVVQLDLDGPGRHEPPCPHDQVSAAPLVGVEVEGNLAIDHGTLAPAHLCHVRPDGAVHGSELGGVACQVGDPGAPDFVLAGKAGHMGARAAHPSPFHHGRPLSSLRQMPGQVLAALSTAEDHRLEIFYLGHRILRHDWGDAIARWTSCFSR